MPSAPPPATPPPPPPPPPPESSEEEAAPSIRLSRRDIFGVLLAGAAFRWWTLNKLDAPAELVTATQGADGRTFFFLKTPKGRMVVLTRDEVGRPIMFDENYNIYYDTNDPKLGIFIVDRQRNVLNFFEGRDGVERRQVGNLRDLKAVRIGSIGGLTLEGDSVMLAFPDQKPAIPLIPPNYPGYPVDDGRGNTVRVPLQLDELEITNLERTNPGLWSLFQKDDEDVGFPGGPFKRAT